MSNPLPVLTLAMKRAVRRPNERSRKARLLGEGARATYDRLNRVAGGPERYPVYRQGVKVGSVPASFAAPRHQDWSFYEDRWSVHPMLSAHDLELTPGFKWGA